jgi:threonine 3-dehydrogenase
VKVIRDATDGNGVDVALEMSGDPNAVRQAFEMLTHGGRVSLLGILDKPMELNLNDAVIFKSANVYGITGRRMFETWVQVRDLLSHAGFREKIASIITHRIAMRDIAKGIELIESKQAAKVALEPKW